MAEPADFGIEARQVKCRRMTIDEALDRLLELGGSDLLLSCGTRARIRKDGNLEPLEGEDAKVLQPSDTQRMMRDVLDVKQWRELERKRHVDFSFTWRERARIRGNAYFQRNSIAASFRLLPLKIPSFDMLGIPESVHRLLERQHGNRSEEHTSELQSHSDLVCRLLLEKKKKKTTESHRIYVDIRHSYRCL